MTKKEYIDFIRNSLQMVDQTQKYHREQVAAAINLAVNTVFYELYNRNPRVMQKSLDRYATEVSGTITTPDSSGRYGTSLSVDVVDLPKKAGGVLDINWNPATATRSNTTAFVPMSTMEGEQLYGAEASLPGNVIGFSFSGPRTIFYWGISASEAANTVLIRLIKQFKSYSNTDNVLLPYGQDQRIIELTREYLGAIPPKDLISDNADIPVRNE